jgi:hypothetical protein
MLLEPCVHFGEGLETSCEEPADRWSGRRWCERLGFHLNPEKLSAICVAARDLLKVRFSTNSHHVADIPAGPSSARAGHSRAARTVSADKVISGSDGLSSSADALSRSDCTSASMASWAG